MDGPHVLIKLFPVVEDVVNSLLVHLVTMAQPAEDDEVDERLLSLVLPRVGQSLPAQPDTLKLYIIIYLLFFYITSILYDFKIDL